VANGAIANLPTVQRQDRAPLSTYEPGAEEDPYSIQNTTAISLIHCCAGLEPPRLVAFLGLEDRVGMGAVAGLQRDVQPRALGRHVEQEPLVADFQDVGAELA
jgi:hypothetical protein